MCGLPRRDTLVGKNNSFKQAHEHEQCIFITFHWRLKHQNSISGTSYLRDINALLQSNELKKLVEQKVKIYFLPHSMFMKYLPQFKVPKYV